MRSLTGLRTQALCFTFLGLAACSGDDNAAPGSAGSAGRGGSGGSGGSTTAEASASDSSKPDVTVTPDSAGDVVTADGDGGLLNCPSLPDGGAAMAIGDSGEGGGVDAGFEFPQTLAETGLYCDFAANVIAPSNKKFRPKYELWSDGAVKTRWVYLPPGKTVDTSDMDHWSMPVGAKFWKEFIYNGKRVETRLIVRVAAGTGEDFLYAAYKWSPDEKTATLWNPGTGEIDYAPIGPGAEGLQHNIPSRAECGRCHGQLPERILGFSAIQLSHNIAGGETITSLAAANLLSAAPDAGGFAVPGNAVEESALGFLHANCGNCHNETPTGITYPRYMVRVLVGNKTVAETNTYRTAVNVPHTWFTVADAGLIGSYRVQGGNPDLSELHYRMSVRGGPNQPVNQQMPPIDTKITTPEGLTIIENWIKALPPPPDAGPSDAGDGG